MQGGEVKAVLFDLDGVLVDSFQAWYNTFNSIRRRDGKKIIPLGLFKKNFGCPIEQDIQLFFPEKTANRLNELKDTYFLRNVRFVKIFPDSAKVLSKVKKSGIKMALISNSTQTIVGSIMKKYKIGKFFDAVLTAEDVKHGKPAQDMILKACKILKIKPENTVLVGDTKNDMIAGKRAGCLTVGYKIKGDYSINSLREIERFIYV